MSQQPKIAILDDYQNVALQMADWSVLDGKATITVFNDHVDDPQTIVDRLRPFEVVCVMRERTPLTGTILEQLPNLRLIASAGPINSSIDIVVAEARGIAVAHTGYDSTPAVELTWALILASVRHIPAENASVRSGGWQRHVGEDLAGRTLGLVGLGHIGAAVATIGKAFRMNVVAWSQNLTAERAAAVGVRAVSKDELFRQADIASIHLLLSKRTRGIVGAAELALMKPTARLINTSRGPLVVEADLIAALRAGKLAGAGIDVFDQEPLPPDHPFRTLPNVVATPHIGFVSHNLYRRFYEDTVANIVRWLEAR
jgi:phosphoglycerate dehydrogenase-like enzyme